MKISKSVQKNTVVSFLRDATFFAERGLRLSRRFDYSRALRCFRRAIELDQENASFHCHLASILAEMGKFQESNDILHHIIDNIDPHLEDVYFYLANNYANLEDFETAEEMAMKYLQTATKRSFAEEAEELLDYIYFEMDLPPRHFLDHSADAVIAKHEQARSSLEEGRFLEAIVLLTEINEIDPEFMPAWNNLSLAYYYAGEMDKAMRIVHETLERDSGNLHALCNLAVLLSHQNKISELLPVIQQLKKVVPFHPEHAYKLATTMGILGQHEEAFRFYTRLLKFSFYADAPTYHYAAISAYLSNHESQAVKWWQKVKQIDPESGVAEYYLEMMRNREVGAEKEIIPYQYQRVQKPKETVFEDFRTDPMIRASLLWALQHGKEDAKQMVIQTLAMIGDDEARNTLYSFSQTTHDPKLQKLALLTLNELDAQYPVEAPPVQRDEAVSSSEELVAELIRDQIKTGNVEFGKWALAVWSRYCDRGTGKELNTVRKIVAWLAALEYSYARKNQNKVTQDYLAKKYGISQATIAKCIKELKALDLYQF